MGVNVNENDARRIASVLSELLEKYDIEDADDKSFAFVEDIVTFHLEDIPIFEKFIKKSYPSSWSWSINNKNVGKITF